jgi:hypothetical protein
MNKQFVAACDKEIEQNKFKGDWPTYKPKEKRLVQEMSWHMNKLVVAIVSGNSEMIKEYSCDVANYCEKAFNIAESLSGEPRVLKPSREIIQPVKKEVKRLSCYDLDDY